MHASIAELGIANWELFALSSLALALAPGPDNLFVLTQAALHGWRVGVTVTLGLCSGLLLHTAGVALGVAAFIQNSVTAFTLLKVLGAAYLLYLAVGAWRADSMQIEGDGESVAATPNLGKMYRRGLLMNVLNPKVAIFFLAFLPQFLDADRGGLMIQIGLLGCVFMLAAFVVFSGVAVGASHLRQWFLHATSAQMWLNRVAAVVFAALAVRLFLTQA